MYYYAEDTAEHRGIAGAENKELEEHSRTQVTAADIIDLIIVNKDKREQISRLIRKVM